MDAAWAMLDAGLCEELPSGSSDEALSKRARLLEIAAAAGRRGDLADTQWLALAQAALEVANRATSLYLDALHGVRKVYASQTTPP